VQTTLSLDERLEELEREVRLLKDLEEIRMLKARYWKACDGDIVVGPSHEVEDVVELYTEDGSWQILPRETPEGWTEPIGGFGREGIREFFAHLRAHFNFIMHFGMAPIIEVDGDRATGHWHYIATMDGPDSESSVLSAGVYLDEYARTDAGWRIKSTRVVTGFRTPLEEGWKKTKYLSPIDET
jgi:hypothetical protein